MILLPLLVACGGGDDGPSGTPAGTSSGDGSNGGSGSSGEQGGSSGVLSSSGEPGSSGDLAATCEDGVLNGDESDVDCGFACEQRCLVGERCNGKLDCHSGICTDGTCAPPSDEDGRKNGTETDVDCGGLEAKPCIAPQQCLANSDCVSNLCQQDGRCAPTHADGAQNLDETDIDCGGLMAPRCPAGRACSQRSDCADGGDCLGNTCQAPTHDDGIKNLAETDTDCGGNAPLRCSIGRTCTQLSDCISATFCDPGDNTCKVPQIDGLANGTETDIDCGGPGRPACEAGQGCLLASDCQSGVCNAAAPAAPPPATGCGGTPKPADAAGSCPNAVLNVVNRCAAPAPTDGIKNGTETDIDCGGAGNPRCATNQQCIVHADCASDGCHATRQVCVERRSCAMTFGGDTCGGPAGSEQGGESCCATIPIQRTNQPRVAMGKFLVTAGRVRQMIQRLNGDVRGFIVAQNLPNTRWNAAWTAFLPSTQREVAQRLGPLAMPDEAGYGTISGARGCQVSVGGGRPYWFNAGDGDGWIPANEAGRYPRDILDQKSQNCIMASLAAAFCVWDGGTLTNPHDLRYAYHNGTVNANGTVNDARKWPWGNLPDPPTTNYGANAACQESNCNSFVVHRWNYNYPAYLSPDSSSVIPAPGRRPAGAGPFGHMDLTGSLFEYSQIVPASGNSTFHVLYKGSFEGHVPTANLPHVGGSGANNRYWARGLRCSYPIP